MRSYMEMLTKFTEDLKEPFDKFMRFTEITTRALEDICGHCVETTPDEDSNYELDIGIEEHGTQEGDELCMSDKLKFLVDIDETVVVDPMASDEKVKKAMRKKYGCHIGELKAEFNRVRKKGKLSTSALTILKD
ncbi:homeobox protein knotted-1-like LET6 [Physcomitrium patens]|uniref:homeobox protein knotted-1-like LET6 n=1 Tax=Physcomitrium patens TaxID=3218 RepID=UPI003CCD7386